MGTCFSSPEGNEKKPKEPSGDKGLPKPQGSRPRAAASGAGAGPDAMVLSVPNPLATVQLPPHARGRAVLRRRSNSDPNLPTKKLHMARPPSALTSPLRRASDYMEPSLASRRRGYSDPGSPVKRAQARVQLSVVGSPTLPPRRAVSKGISSVDPISEGHGEVGAGKSPPRMALVTAGSSSMGYHPTGGYTTPPSRRRPDPIHGLARGGGAGMGVGIGAAGGGGAHTDKDAAMLRAMDPADPPALGTKPSDPPRSVTFSPTAQMRHYRVLGVSPDKGATLSPTIHEPEMKDRSSEFRTVIPWLIARAKERDQGGYYELLAMLTRHFERTHALEAAAKACKTLKQYGYHPPLDDMAVDDLGPDEMTPDELLWMMG